MYLGNAILAVDIFGRAEPWDFDLFLGIGILRMNEYKLAIGQNCRRVYSAGLKSHLK